MQSRADLELRDLLRRDLWTLFGSLMNETEGLFGFRVERSVPLASNNQLRTGADLRNPTV